MKNQAKLIFSILVLIIITVFAIQNTNNVQLDLIFVEFQTPLVLIILFSLLIGVIVGMIGTAVNNSSKRQEIKDLTKQVDKEKELRNRLEAEFDTVSNGQKADTIALEMVREVYEPLVKAIDSSYKLYVEFK